MKNFYQRGITILEILIAITVIGILAAMVLPGFAKIKTVQVLKSTTEDIVSILGKARSETLASLNSSSYGVHFETNKVTFFIGTSFSSGDANNQVTNLISPATISNINLADSSANVYFNRLSGLPSTTGTITLSVPGASSRTITIFATGSVGTN